ncbi:hypothetical protein BP6252_11853 [Coleophoma cylindrospora]|uniref:Wax synthase domain-containing protein n=1 Tax=Coleophoma cylindrospora TaxID=1849047 RepID=A0A3D8QL80_9HELO|nr:hypothetical protein BP6252_11853 [Coleophoma cylindrospora]
MISFSQDGLQKWLASFDLHRFGTAYACTIGVICCLAYAATQSPSSRIRWWMLVPITGLTMTTARSVLDIPAFSPFRVAIGMTLGVNLVLESINHLCIRKVFIDLNKRPKGESAVYYALRQGTDLVFNKRLIGTAHQVKGVPKFSSKDPSYVPSRTQFITFRATRAILLYLVLGMLLREPPPEIVSFCRPSDRTSFPIRLVQGTVGTEEFTTRFAFTLSYLASSVLFQILGHDCISLIAVGILNNDPAAWPPRFDSITTAYTIRRFWNPFWHQDLRATLTCYSPLISDNILQLPKKGVLQRYAKIYLGFGISGLMHIYSDLASNVPLSETKAMNYFLLSATGVLIEDLAIAIYRLAVPDRGSAGQPPLWQKVVGFLWTLFYTSLVTPQWACTLVLGGTLPMPGFPRLESSTPP